MLSRTLPTQVAHHIRERILSGELAPGDRIIETELAEEFEVSRHTLRSALQTLTHEGLLEQSQFKSTHVARPTAATCSRPTRCATRSRRWPVGWPPSARRPAARRRWTPRWSGCGGGQAGDKAAMKAADFDFHTAVVELADHALLREHYRMLHGRTRLYLNLTATVGYELRRDRGEPRGARRRDPRGRSDPRRGAGRRPQHG